jgi:hypothetical protein
LCQANVKVIRESEANPQKTNLDKSYCHDRGMCNMIFINDRGRFSTQLAGRLAVENAEEDG